MRASVFLALALSLAGQTRVTPGQLLVATDHLNDPQFSKSVVLILASNARGVEGIWINRPTPVQVSELFPSVKSSAPVYQGGPVRIGINGLIRSAEAPEGGSKLFGDVWLIADQAALKKLAASNKGLRIYVGTCGWSVPQLDSEIRAYDAWTILPASAGSVFDSDPGTLWNRLASRNVARLLHEQRAVLDHNARARLLAFGADR